MAEKPFDLFFMLVFLVGGAIMLVAGIVMAQPTRIILGILLLIAGLLSFFAFNRVRKRMRR